MISPLKAFALAVLVGAAVPLGFGAYVALGGPPTPAATPAVTPAVTPAYRELTPRIFVSTQIGPEDLARYRNRTDILAVIDLRPDGEVEGQPTAAQMAAEAKSQKLDFAYVPTPHGPVPEDVVDQFAKALESSRKPVLLYCRSGARAARVWALSEASRPGGMNAAAILGAVRSAGLSADDEKSEIERRIAARPQR